MRRAAGLALRGAGLGLAAAGLAILLVLVRISVYALVSPFTRVPVPPACGGTQVAATVAGRVDVPGFGPGIQVAVDGPTRLVAVAGPDGRTAGGTAVVLG